MNQEELFENRRAVSLRLCEQIRQNNYQLIKAKYFKERPYCDGEKKHKFNNANYLRLLAAERNYSDPRWYSVDDIQKNKLKLKENAKAELLEEWQNDSTECFLKEFYNASDIEEKETLKIEKTSLDYVLDFLLVRGILDNNEKITTLKEGVEAVESYAFDFCDDELTAKLTAQMWLVESKLNVKMKLFLPVFSEDILLDLEKNPEIIFQKINLANDILKNLRKEKVKPIAEEIETDDLFQGLKIIYHGSEVEILDKNGFEYPQESILTAVAAYQFLIAWKKNKSENFKTWLDFSYKEYEHGEFLLTSEDSKLEKPISHLFKIRLNENRQELLKIQQNLPKYIIAGTGELISDTKILNMVETETEKFQKAMAEFEIEENRYFDNNVEI